MLRALDSVVKSQLLTFVRHLLMVNGDKDLSTIDRECLVSLGTHIFEQEYSTETGSTINHSELKELLDNETSREQFLQILSVLPFIDGEINLSRVEYVLATARALGLATAYTAQLELVLEHKLAELMQDMTVKNYKSIYDKTASYTEALAVFKPYEDGHEDLLVYQRYDELTHAPTNSLGYQFWDLYHRNKYVLPGKAGSYEEYFSVRHDATHLLAGYKTNAEGEILVSTFTGHMHGVYPISAHVFPVIFSWHLGMDPLGGINQTNTGKLNLDKFWLAWRRGTESKIDTFDPSWDFWDHAQRPLVELQTEYQL